MEFVALVIIVFFIGIAIIIIDDSNKKKRNRKYTNNYDIPYITPPPTPEPQGTDVPDINQIKDLPYARKNLLTMTEYYFYKVLKSKCDAANMLICPKVRVEDFVDVTEKEYKTKQKFRGYIKSRHVDFLICDANLKIIAAVELDDSSHNNKKAADTDSFKNRLYEKINLPLFRIRTNQNYDAAIENMISVLSLDK